MWQQQAEKMGVPLEAIKCWYRDLRTRLSRKKSGQAAEIPEDRPDSDRDRWIIDNLGFLRQHIVQQVQRRPLVSVRARTKNQAPAPSLRIQKVMVVKKMLQVSSPSPRAPPPQRLHRCQAGAVDLGPIQQTTTRP